MFANTKQLKVYLLPVTSHKRSLPTSVSFKEPLKNIRQPCTLEEKQSNKTAHGATLPTLPVLVRAVQGLRVGPHLLGWALASISVLPISKLDSTDFRKSL